MGDSDCIKEDQGAVVSSVKWNTIGGGGGSSSSSSNSTSSGTVLRNPRCPSTMMVKVKGRRVRFNWTVNSSSCGLRRQEATYRNWVERLDVGGGGEPYNFGLALTTTIRNVVLPRHMIAPPQHSS